MDTFFGDQRDSGIEMEPSLPPLRPWPGSTTNNVIWMSQLRREDPERYARDYPYNVHHERSRRQAAVLKSFQERYGRPATEKEKILALQEYNSMLGGRGGFYPTYTTFLELEERSPADADFFLNVVAPAGEREAHAKMSAYQAGEKGRKEEERISALMEEKRGEWEREEMKERREWWTENGMLVGERSVIKREKGKGKERMMDGDREDSKEEKEKYEGRGLFARLLNFGRNLVVKRHSSFELKDGGADTH